MRKILTVTLILALFGLASCEKEAKTSLNMKQVHQEKGVPVKVEKIGTKSFITHLDYYAELSGAEESSVYAAVNDRVERLYVRIGDYVKAGQLIISFPSDNSQSQYQQAKLAHEIAKASYDRISRLKNSGVISAQEFDNVKSQFDITQANLESARKMIHVTAPISGHITRINVTESQNVVPGTELMVVSRLDKIKAKIWISDKMIDQVKVGLPATASWNGTVLEGTVTRVDNGISSEYQAFGAIVEFNNPHNKIRTGVTADIQIETYQNPKAIILEKQQLINEQMNQFVFLASGGMAHKRAVQLGKQQGILVEVLDGLNPEEQLIISGHRMVNDGVKINIIN